MVTDEQFSKLNKYSDILGEIRQKKGGRDLKKVKLSRNPSLIRLLCEIANPILERLEEEKRVEDLIYADTQLKFAALKEDFLQKKRENIPIYTERVSSSVPMRHSYHPPTIQHYFGPQGKTGKRTDQQLPNEERPEGKGVENGDGEILEEILEEEEEEDEEFLEEVVSQMFCEDQNARIL